MCKYTSNTCPSLSLCAGISIGTTSLLSVVTSQQFLHFNDCAHYTAQTSGNNPISCLLQELLKIVRTTPDNPALRGAQYMPPQMHPAGPLHHFPSSSVHPQLVQQQQAYTMPLGAHNRPPFQSSSMQAITNHTPNLPGHVPAASMAQDRHGHYGSNSVFTYGSKWVPQSESYNVIMDIVCSVLFPQC